MTEVVRWGAGLCQEFFGFGGFVEGDPSKTEVGIHKGLLLEAVDLQGCGGVAMRVLPLHNRPWQLAPAVVARRHSPWLAPGAPMAAMTQTTAKYHSTSLPVCALV